MKSNRIAIAVEKQLNCMSRGQGKYHHTWRDRLSKAKTPPGGQKCQQENCENELGAGKQMPQCHILFGGRDKQTKGETK